MLLMVVDAMLVSASWVKKAECGVMSTCRQYTHKGTAVNDCNEPLAV